MLNISDMGMILQNLIILVLLLLAHTKKFYLVETEDSEDSEAVYEEAGQDYEDTDEDNTGTDEDNSNTEENIKIAEDITKSLTKKEKDIFHGNFTKEERELLLEMIGKQLLIMRKEES